MKLAMYKGKGNFYDKLIRMVTFSKYSHCELVIEGICYSSSPRDRGVRMKYIYLDENWDTFDLPDKYDPVYALNIFTKHAGKKYDWIGAITSVLPFHVHLSDRFFCSELCSDMLNIPKSKSYTPIKLLRKVV
jgi:hypothetical protein